MVRSDTPIVDRKRYARLPTRWPLLATGNLTMATGPPYPLSVSSVASADSTARLSRPRTRCGISTRCLSFRLRYQLRCACHCTSLRWCAMRSFLSVWERSAPLTRTRSQVLCCRHWRAPADLVRAARTGTCPTTVRCSLSSVACMPVHHRRVSVAHCTASRCRDCRVASRRLLGSFICICAYFFS